MQQNNKIPILKIDDFLIISVQIELDDELALSLQEQLANRIKNSDSVEGVLIDLTAVEVVDSFIAKLLGDMANIARLMGTNLVVTGIQPAVAITLVELGIELKDVATALNLQRGIEILRKGE